jgi:hypothetical protein
MPLLEVEKEKNMKGGEVSMLHIIVKDGMVVQVIELSRNPNKEKNKILESEFDYKVEYLDDYEIMDQEG